MAPGVESGRALKSPPHEDIAPEKKETFRADVRWLSERVETRGLSARQIVTISIENHSTLPEGSELAYQ